MTDTPLPIQRFETIQLASIIVGALFAVDEGRFLDAIGSAIALIALTLLVSRGRRNWAKWLILATFVLGGALLAWQAPTILALGYPFFSLLVSLALTLMQAIALVFLFTPQAADWLRRKQSPA